MKDYLSADEQIQKRIKYLEALCRNIIKNDLRDYIDKIKMVPFQ